MSINGKKYMFIINPIAGAGYKNNLKEIIEQKALQLKHSVEIVFTTHAGHAFEIAKQADENTFQTIVAVGGDGTINEVGRGLIHKSISLAIVPMGSGNGLARYSKIPLNAVKAIETAFTGNIKKMDVIKINHQHSFNVSGVGFDAAVAHQFQHLHKRGFWGYFKLVIKQTFSFSPLEVSINLNENGIIKNVKDKVFILAIANSNQFGNNAIIAPNADTADGKFNLVLVKPFSLLKMPYYAFMMFTNKFHKIKAVINIEASQCNIIAATQQWHVDGEPVIFEQMVEIKILPLAIQLIVPKL
jgi:YegS/Rv2252/BmrU family lipid kinase